MNDYKTYFGERLREIRLSQEDESLRSQEKFAEHIGVSQGSLSNYEGGKKPPRFEVAIDIANRLGVSLDWLCGIEPKKDVSTYKDAIDAIEFLKKEFSSTVVRYDVGSDNGVYVNIEDEKLNKYYTEHSQMVELLNNGTITQKLFDLWEDDQEKTVLSRPINGIVWDEDGWEYDDENGNDNDENIPF